MSDREPAVPRAEGSRSRPPARTNGLLPAGFRVLRTRRENHDTVTLELAGLEDGDGLAFEPGQFNMLYAFGHGDVPISISGDPGRPQTVVHTVRAVGDVTTAICALGKGDVVGVRGPFGTAWPIGRAAGRDVIVVAGGIGVAPVRSILYHVLAHRSRYGRVAFLYGARTPRDLIFTRDLERWRARFDVEVEISVDTADRSWRGNVGTVTTLIGRAPFDPGRATAFVCGPEVMMRFVAIELMERGVAADDIFVSLERNMKCGVGVCGHCQLGPHVICRDGPVMAFPRVRPWLTIREM